MLYENVKRIADAQNVSILQIERECGIKPSSIYHWNENKPSYDKVLLVARYLKVSVEELTDGTVEIKN